MPRLTRRCWRATPSRSRRSTTRSSPRPRQVAAGTEVTFVNDGQNDHNVVPEDEGADWAIDGDDFHPGDEQSFTFDDPGVYRYYCSIHGTIDAGMPGVLVVE